MTTTPLINQNGQRRLILTWSITFLILFPLLIVLGLLMRLNQGEVSTLDPGTFYSIMTLHGLGMAAILFSISYAALFYLIGTRHVNLNVKLGYYVYFFIIAGSVGLAIATLIGKYAAGWYLLYPLPFKGATWQSWTITLSTISLLILGMAWLIGCLHILYSIGKRYGGFGRIAGWQYFKRTPPKEELPAIIMITTVSLVPGVLAFLAGAVFLIMFLIQVFEPAVKFEPLLLKNLVFIFGHILVNITLYCGLGWVYTLYPQYSGRKWTLNAVTVLAWNATFFFILFAYFHHLYMDFVQPISLQYIGQFASYLSAVPATAVTIFGIFGQIYRSGIRWSIVPLAFLLGITGWAIGGFAAVVDSTIILNTVLHNTLWVPAHFHTYLLMGVSLFIFGFLYHLANERTGTIEGLPARTGFWIYIFGSYGFLLMFYLGGINSIPRRFAEYSTITTADSHKIGVILAKTGSLFVGVLLIGIIIMYFPLLTRLIRKRTVGETE